MYRPSKRGGLSNVGQVNPGSCYLSRKDCGLHRRDIQVVKPYKCGWQGPAGRLTNVWHGHPAGPCPGRGDASEAEHYEAEHSMLTFKALTGQSMDSCPCYDLGSKRSGEHPRYITQPWFQDDLGVVRPEFQASRVDGEGLQVSYSLDRRQW